LFPHGRLIRREIIDGLTFRPMVLCAIIPFESGRKWERWRLFYGRALGRRCGTFAEENNVSPLTRNLLFLGIGASWLPYLALWLYWHIF